MYLETSLIGSGVKFKEGTRADDPQPDGFIVAMWVRQFTPAFLVKFIRDMKVGEDSREDGELVVVTHSAFIIAYGQE